MKKYVVFYSRKDIEAGSKDEHCNHHFEYFDELPDAICYYEGILNTSKKYILKTVTYKTTYEEIENPTGPKA